MAGVNEISFTVGRITRPSGDFFGGRNDRGWKPAQRATSVQ